MKNEDIDVKKIYYLIDFASEGQFTISPEKLTDKEMTWITTNWSGKVSDLAREKFEKKQKMQDIDFFIQNDVLLSGRDENYKRIVAKKIRLFGCNLCSFFEVKKKDGFKDWLCVTFSGQGETPVFYHQIGTMKNCPLKKNDIQFRHIKKNNIFKEIRKCEKIRKKTS